MGRKATPKNFRPVTFRFGLIDRRTLLQESGHRDQVTGRARLPLSLQNPTQCLRRLPCLFVAHVGVADRGADIVVAEEFLDLPKIFPTWLRRMVAALCRSPWAVISPTPRALHAARSRGLNARLENGSPENPANTNCDQGKAIPPWSIIRRPLKFS